MELFGLITLMLFLILIGICFDIFRYAKKRGLKTLKLISGILLGSGLFVLLSFFIYAGTHLILISSPNYVFSEAFGFEPPQEISELQSKVSYDYTYIRFKASPSVIQKLLVPNYHEITRKEFVENLKACDFDFGIGAPPDWWKPLDGNLEKFYENKILINDSFLSCDELTGVVSFYWVHID